MPKRQKESKLLPGEGRPTAGFSLGDFLATPAQASNKETKPNSSMKDEDFPGLGSTVSTPQDSANSWASSLSSSNNKSESHHNSTSNVTSSSENSSSKSHQLAYNVTKTKKGSLPIRLENRNKGKKVTVIFNVSGDAKELLKDLKHAAGCGGVIREDTVELQGERADLVEKYLRNKFNWRK